MASAFVLVGVFAIRVSANGKAARLAVVLDDGAVVIAGDDVAREAEAVAVNGFRNMLQGKGFLRVLGVSLAPSVQRRGSSVARPTAIDPQVPATTA